MSHPTPGPGVETDPAETDTESTVETETGTDDSEFTTGDGSVISTVDGVTQRVGPDGSQYVAETDVTGTVQALSALYPDRF